MQRLGGHNVATVQVRAVLAGQIFDLIMVTAPDDARVEAGDLPVIEYDVAIRAAANGQRLVLEWPCQAAFTAALQDNHR